MSSKLIAFLSSRFFWCALFISSLANGVNAQSDTSQQKAVESVNRISQKALGSISNKYSLIQKLIQRKTEKMLSRMQKLETELRKQVQASDTIKSNQLFAGSDARYQQLSAELNQPPASFNQLSSYKQFVPGIDSMQTSVQFLSQKWANIPGVSIDKLQKLQAISQQLQQLQGKLQAANNAQDYIRARTQQLKQQLLQTGLGKQLLGMNKEAYYYQQQLSSYKDLLNDRQKMEEAVLTAARQFPAFQSFWQKYSILAQLFPMPPGLGTVQALNGLQTRSGIQSVLQSTGGSVGPDPQYVQQQVQQAQSSLDALKDKVASLGGTNGSGEMTMPDFQPNSQHTKRFLQRIEYGFNIQNAPGTNILPATSNMAVTVGYRLSDKATVGVGASYIMGWGSGISHVSLSSQGAGLRSFVDIKAKGSFWVSGGFEYNYLQQFNKLSDVRDMSAWRRSALIGLTKKATIGKKTANIQILYDFLYNQELPRGQMLKFRVGYSF